MHALQSTISARIFFFAFALLVLPTFLHAQLVGGTIAGDVVDPNNASVVGAQVPIRNEEAGGVRQLITAQGGAFSAPSIPVGTYSITVNREGFAPLKRTGIALT